MIVTEYMMKRFYMSETLKEIVHPNASILSFTHSEILNNVLAIFHTVKINGDSSLPCQSPALFML